MYIPRRIGCYCVCKKFNKSTLRTFLKNTFQLDRFRDVLHFKVGLLKNSEGGNIFLFPYGVIVIWNLSVSEELQLIQDLKPHCEEPLEDVETDHFEYYYWDKPPKVKNDEIFLSKNEEQTDDERVKVALSHGLAQSIKLSVFEDEIDGLIEQTKQFPNELASHGQISLTRKEIFKKMGQLWLQKNEVNLHSDILDTPEFFFENPILLPLFEAIIDYLDVEQRLQVLNSRLNVVGDMFNILNEEVHAQHETRLEWIIIALIVVEVVLQVLHLAFTTYSQFFTRV